MALLYILLLALAVVVYICTPRMRLRARIMTAVLVFLVPAIASTALIIFIGDPIPPDAVTVDLNEGNS